MKNALVLAAALLAAAPAPAQTTVKNAWIRGTVAQQMATGLFAQITSARGGRLVEASSPLAGIVEIHEMTLDGNVVRMRAVDAVDLPAGRAVELRPGGLHVMLMDLRRPLQPGETVPVTLVIEGADRKRELVRVQATVRPLATPADGGHAPHKP